MSVEFDRESPGSLTQGLLIGKLLLGGLGVGTHFLGTRLAVPQRRLYSCGAGRRP